MTAPREILPGRTYMITRRCAQRQFLLRPDETTNAVFEYCLGEAASRFGIGLIAWCAMSNHYHAIVYDPDGRLPAFLAQMHAMIARSMNVRWGRWEGFWSIEPACVTLLPTAEAVFEKVCYVLANPVSAGLVDRLADWPGSTSLHHLDGRQTQHARPTFFFSPEGRMPASVELSATQPPCSAVDESASDWATRVRVELARIEEDARTVRLRDGRAIVGRKAILRAAASDAPQTETAHRKLRPTVACRDKARRDEALERLAIFRADYRHARLRYAAGDRDVTFPAGTYQLRLTSAVRCVPFPETPLAA